MKALIVGIFQDLKTKSYTEIDTSLDGALTKFVDGTEKATDYKKITVITKEWQGYDTLYVVGLGKIADYDLNKHRLLIGQVIKNTHYEASVVLDSFVPEEIKLPSYAEVTAEAVDLAQRPHIHYKKEETPQRKEVNILSSVDVVEAVNQGKLMAKSINVARDLMNRPANYLTATDLANVIADFAKSHHLEYKVLNKSHMEELGMGGILGVNQGSTEEPKLICVKFMNSPSKEVLALVGKGLTYDTGGYSMKTPTFMYGMHGDMGGASTVFGAFCGIVEAKLPVNVILAIPATDNMVSADAIKPGDVLTTMNGTTVEVNNTDAEGRLILSDALTYVTKLGATRIIDAATLTGAVIRSLGEITTGMFTNDNDFASEFEQTANASGESIWQLPIFEPEQKLLKTSEVADLKNCPEGPGAIIAAAFLKEFVEERVKWIHLDIAGSSETKKAHELGPAGATGAMVRTLINYAKTLV